jgi:bifunctional pyridoxal-dependent enzyme with beta-cystathionase and maltose regulon repressor activities
VNNCERVNFHIGRQFGIGMNICVRVNHAVSGIAEAGQS